MDRRVKVSFVLLVLALLLALFFVLPSGKSQSPYFGCYSDSLCTSTLTSIDWGTLAPGGSVKRCFYIKNLDDARLSGLIFSMNEVVPEGAEKYLRLESSVGSASLRKNDYTEVELTLNVDPLIHDVSSFSFDVLVTASFSESGSSVNDSSDGGEQSDASSGPAGGGGGWEGSDTDFEDTIKISSEEERLSSIKKFVLFLAVTFCVYLLLGKREGR